MKFQGRRFGILAIVIVFAVCLGLRIFYIGEKKSLEGDEHTSLTLSYNAIGYGDKSFDTQRVYTEQDFARILYVDDEPGLKGYFDDICALWHYNRDPSHASLYYMLLRTALLEQDSPQQRSVIDRGCGLNLLFFAGSFVCMVVLLCRLFPNRWLLISSLLLLAYANALSVSITLLIREYQLAEFLTVLFLLLAYRIVGKISRGGRLLTVGSVVGYSVVAALLMSAGYFCALLVIAVSLCLAFFVVKQRLPRWQLSFFFVAAVLSLVLCVGLYRGFFNFLYDVRMTEVADKVEGGGLMFNLVHSAAAGLRYFVRNMLGEPFALFASAVLLFSLCRKTKIKKMPCLWMFLCSIIWIVVVVLLSQWKMTRYFSPCVPLAMVFVGYYVVEAVVSVSAKWLWLAVGLFFSNFLIDGRVEYLQRGESFFPSSKRMLLYATNVGERNSASLIASKMSGSQECAIIDRLDLIERYASPLDSVAYLFADDSVASEVEKHRVIVAKYDYNVWLDLYCVKVGLQKSSAK